LNRWGNQRMGHVYPLLKKHVGPAQAVCQLLETHILDPMMAGEPLQINPPRAGRSGTLESKIQAAVEEYASGSVEA
jgi:hypothetical protein